MPALFETKDFERSNNQYPFRERIVGQGPKPKNQMSGSRNTLIMPIYLDGQSHIPSSIFFL